MRLAELELSTRADALVARVIGEVDISNARELGATIRDALADDMPLLVLDLRDVTYLDSAGIQMIYRLHDRLTMRGHRLRVVVAPDAAVNQALALSGVLSHIGAVDSIEAAIAP